jgi:hypothetical protein
MVLLLEMLGVLEVVLLLLLLLLLLLSRLVPVMLLLLLLALALAAICPPRRHPVGGPSVVPELSDQPGRQGE